MRVRFVDVGSTLVLMLVLAACSREAPNDGRQPFQSEGVHFSLTPSAARDCMPETRYQAVLRWNVERESRARVEIRIDEPGGPLLARSNESSGNVDTGPWVHRGMWFLLIDRDSGEVLAAQRAGPDNCD